MAIPWLVVLKAVPWTQVINNAPKVADGARKLWNSVSSKSPPPVAPTGHPGTAQVSGDVSVATLQERLAAMKISTDALHEQMLASSDLIKELANQNSQLIKRIEETRIRLIGLMVATSCLAVIAVASLVMALSG